MLVSVLVLAVFLPVPEGCFFLFVVIASVFSSEIAGEARIAKEGTGGSQVARKCEAGQIAGYE